MSFTASLEDVVRENRNGLLAAAPHWRRVALGDVATILNGYAFPSSRFTKDRGTPLLRIRDVLTDTTDACFDGDVNPQFLVTAGDLVVGMDGDFNAALWRGPVAALNQRVCKITPNEDLFTRRFLSYVLPGYLSAINEYTSAITVKHLSSRTIAEIPVPLPPLSEQRRIVDALEEHLSELDAAVAGLERARANAVRLRDSVIASFVLPLEVSKALGKACDSTKWEWHELRTLGALKGGITKGQKRRDSDKLRSVPYLRVANVQRGRLDLSEMKTIEATEAEIAELRLENGDVLFNEGGDRDKLGRGWVWHCELPECIHQNHVFRFRPDAHRVDSKFVSYYGNSHGQRYFLEQGKQTTNLASINLTKLGALPVPVPPLSVQKAVVAAIDAAVSSAERAMADVDTQLLRATRLRQSILKHAFEGKLVPQDPNDEPASVLLERIRAERESDALRAPKARSRAKTSRKAPRR